MLEKYICWVSKQPLPVELEEIHQVYFSRVGSSMGANAARTFDLRIVQKQGHEFTFTSINKEEKAAVETFLKGKSIKIKAEQVPDADLLAQGLDDDDEEMGSLSENSDKPKKMSLSDDDSETDGQWFQRVCEHAVLIHP